MANYDIKLNTCTGGIYCFFEHNGMDFCADLSDVPFSIDYINECMIFPAKNGKITRYKDLYCKRNIPITNEALIACIEEFKSQIA